MKKDISEKILNTLLQQSILKQKVYDNLLKTFKLLKIVLRELAEEYNRKLLGKDKRIHFILKSQGEYDCYLKLGSDILFFSMHTNVFQFNREHIIWQHSYIKKNPGNAYSGMISIYNFLADSFKYKRYQDLGYLISRIFVNHENHFMVEGKRQSGFSKKDFSTSIINKNELREIIEKSINYSLSFDLLVPPYKHVKIISVAQIHAKIKDSGLKTAKRLGFQFNTDDIN